LTFSTYPRLRKYLARGPVIMGSDTIPGFAAIFSPAGMASLQVLKKRRGPFLVTVPDPTWFLKLSMISYERAMRTEISNEIITTFILPGRQGGSIGLRLPAEGPYLSFLKYHAAPVYSTSVNGPGEPPMMNYRAMGARYGLPVFTAPRTGRPSRILDLTGALPRVIRA